VFNAKQRIEDGSCPEDLAKDGDIVLERLFIRFGGKAVPKTTYTEGHYTEFFEKTPRKKLSMEGIAKSTDGLDPEKHARPDLPGFSSHIAASKSGCPVCKQPLKDLMTDRTERGWRNHCQDRTCPGVLEYTIDYETSAAAVEKQEKKKPGTVVKENSPPVCDDWEFVYNIDEWMGTDGKVVPIKKLPEKEFVDSVWALIHANFSKVGTTLAWAKQLPTHGAAYAYPREALAVGARDAKDKLEEFYENAEERGWLTTGRE
jgi:hypothetical protein